MAGLDLFAPAKGEADVTIVTAIPNRGHAVGQKQLQGGSRPGSVTQPIVRRMYVHIG
jgi:hypothetical protein